MTPPAPLTAATRIQSPLSRVFGILSDHERLVAVIDGLESLQPRSEETRSEGALFTAVLRIPGRRITTEVELTELVEDHRILWRSVESSSRSLLFETKAIEPELTAVRLSVSYDRPTGIAAVVLGPIVEETVKARIRATLEHLSKMSSGAE